MHADGEAEAAGLLPHIDVIVIGNGPAGTSAALTLARLGVRVALLDGGLTRPRLGESLPPAATPLLQELGVWTDLEAQGHRRAPGLCSRWGGSEAAEVDFVRQPYATGWHLDRGRFDAHLVQSARRAGVLWCGRTRVRAMTRTARGWWQLTLTHPTGACALDTSVLVDASGRARWATRALGVRVVAYDRLVATVATYAPSAADPDQRTVVEARAGGMPRRSPTGASWSHT